MRIANAFSLNMIQHWDDQGRFVLVTPVGVDKVRSLLKGGVESFVGHEDTAAVLTALLGIQIPCNRGSISIGPEGGAIIVAQVQGRLPAGTTVLPEGVRIEFFLVRLTDKRDNGILLVTSMI